LSCLLNEQLLEPALNLADHCCGLEFRVLNGYDQKFLTISPEVVSNNIGNLQLQVLIAADQASVFMAMMSDHNSSDLAPQRQEMSVENVSSGLVPQGQKASDYVNSDPVPPRQNVVPTTEKTDSSQQGLEF
ncbi:hypothetical protein Tco_0283421, partial [Tanacetum coccineum]